MQPEPTQGLTTKATWMRGLYIVIFAVILWITKVVMWAVVILQFLITLFTGETNARLRAFGLSLAAFIYQIVTFVTFNSDERPFPFSSWPESAVPGPGQKSAPDNPPRD